MMTMKARYTFRIACLLIVMSMLSGTPSVGIQAQVLQATRSHYSTDDGLCSNAISSMIQDDYGYLWLGTWNGLSRFDGYHFTNYKTGNASGIALLHNRVKDLAVDNQQNIWMRMYDGRVFVLKRSIDKIINPFEGVSGHDQFKATKPLTVTSTGDVLAVIDGVGLYKLRMEHDGVRQQLITTGGLIISSMAEGYQDDIWLGTDKGVHRMDISNLTIEHKGIFLEESILSLYSNGYNIYVGTQSGKLLSFAYGQNPKLVYQHELPVNAVFVDSHGLVWFSDTRHGALCYYPSTGRVRYFTQRIGVPDYDTEGCHFREVGGVVWIRMNQGGYGYYNRQRDEVEYFHNDPSIPWNLSNTVNASLETQDGVVWESTSRRGLEKLEILKNTITRTQLLESDEMVPENEIRAIYYDRQRQMLFLANKAGQLFTVTQGGQPQAVTGAQHLGRIYGISKDSKGNYWMATKGNGLYRLTPHPGGSYDIEHFTHDDSNPYSLSNDKTYYAAEDKQGNIWVATYGGGVNVLTKDKNGRYIFLHPGNSMKTYPYKSYQKVRTVMADNEGNIWAGTTDGLLVMSLKHNVFKIEALEASKEQPEFFVRSNDIVCLALDRQGAMWVGTNGGGLSHVIGKDSKGKWLFENFGTEQGLPSEEVSSITFDSGGNVWFATDHVICSYNVAKGIFTTFGSLDGVDETMCSEGAAVYTADGVLIFGTTDGYYTVDRKKLINDTGTILKLRITDFWLNDKLQSPRLTDLFDYYVPDSKQVELQSHSDVVSFRFASLNYQLQHRMHYQYMLEGYDHEWKTADRTRTVTYASLPTGDYTFKVKAFLLESPDKYDMKQIKVIVPPYFLLSSGAIWLYMAIFAAALFVLMFWTQKKVLAEAGKKGYAPSDEPSETTETPVNDKFMEHVEAWLEQYAPNAQTTADTMTADLGTLLPAFEEQLRQYTGKTPKEVLTDYRMNRAVRYLEDTNESIAVIAYEAGFGDATTFTRIFKAKTGDTPSAYRDAHRSNSNEATDDYELLD